MASPELPDPAVLREYALLADGHRGLVIGPHGDIVWGCFPRWDSDAMFSALLGGEAFYEVRPDCRHTWGGHYEDGSLIWRSRWLTQSAVVECREALSYPGSPGRAAVIRRLFVTDGSCDIDVRLALRRSFGTTRPTHVRKGDDGVWQARLAELYLRWQGPADARYDGDNGCFAGHVTVRAGQVHDFVLEVSTEPLEGPIDAHQMWEATEQAWAATARQIDLGLATKDVQHGLAVLRGMTGPSGGMVAAATTSLPERSGADRNYDYRYAWIRDQCYTGLAAATAEVDDLLDDAVRFVTERLLDDGPQLRPAYRVDGSAVPAQRDLELPGYPGSPTVRIGNRAGKQFQLDAFGDALMLLAAAAHRDRLEPEGWRAAAAAAAAIESRWQEPDAGIWETENEWWSHSRLEAAAGLRAFAAVAGPGADSNKWSALADGLVAETAARCLHPSGHWTRSPSDSHCDAALLLPQVRGLLPPDDPRSVATRRIVHDDLTSDGYVYRYNVRGQPLGVGEGAFLLCGYWLAMAELQAGRVVAARGWFERSRAACGPPALYTEEYDVEQRQLRGNFPQAFVHAAMLEAATRLGQELAE